MVIFIANMSIEGTTCKDTTDTNESSAHIRDTRSIDTERQRIYL